MTFPDAKQRFADRVTDYVRYRPGYPAGLLDVLRQNCGLRPEHSVADIGCGTGLLAEVFLKNGNRVSGVEPNAEMRAAGLYHLAPFSSFTNVSGSAEATTLPSQSADFITAGQAFHWFELDTTRREFQRIQRPGGWIVLVWNSRDAEKSPFAAAYEAFLLRFGTDYERVKSAYPETRNVSAFFGADRFYEARLANEQMLDWDGLAGRTRSSSYMPGPQHARYMETMEALEQLFRAHERNGKVHMRYTTRIFYGQLPQAISQGETPQ